MKRLLIALFAIFGLTIALASPANAGYVTRTFSAYDLTQCSCTYNTYKTASFVQSAPLVRVTSYYDSVITATTNTYTRGVDVNLYRAYNGKGSVSGTAIYTSYYEPVYVLCWVTASSGALMDKVGAKLTVNDTYTMYLFYVPDQYIRDYVTPPDHHC